MLATEEMVAEPLAGKVCWSVRMLYREDRNGVDVKEVAPALIRFAFMASSS
jgi:hypothetical protein